MFVIFVVARQAQPDELGAGDGVALYVERVQADELHVKDEEVGVVADDRTVVGNGHLGDDMVCFIGTLDNLKKDFV